MEQKTCSVCCQTKAPEEFYRDRGRRDGREYRCKTCSLQKYRNYYRKDPETVIKKIRSREGTRPPEKPWPDGTCNYHAAHRRIRRVYGRASGHRCVDCLDQAQEWSYDFNCPDERSEVRTDGRDGIVREVSYSPNPGSYSPRCVPCHTKFDKRNA